MNFVNTQQHVKLDLDWNVVKLLNSLLGDQFATQHGRKWVKITKSDQTSEIQLDAPISNEKAIEWFNKKLQGTVENYVFAPCSEGKYRLVIPEPIAMNASTAIGKTIGFTTIFCRFPHMYLRMLESPFNERMNAKVLVVGPGMIIPKDFGEPDPLLQDATYFPQLSELFHIYPQLTAMDKSGPVIDAMRLKRHVRVSYSRQFAKHTLTTQLFSRHTEKYRALGELFSRALNTPFNFKVVEGDIADKTSESRFDVIVATRVLCFIPDQNNAETPEEVMEIAVTTLCHLFQALTSTGKLYIDQFSIDYFIDLSQTNLGLLLEQVRTKLNLSPISNIIIPHDATLLKDGRYCIESQITSNGILLPIPTDNIYEFTLKQC